MIYKIKKLLNKLIINKGITFWRVLKIIKENQLRPSPTSVNQKWKGDKPNLNIIIISIIEVKYLGIKVLSDIRKIIKKIILDVVWIMKYLINLLELILLNSKLKKIKLKILISNDIHIENQFDELKQRKRLRLSSLKLRNFIHENW